MREINYFFGRISHTNLVDYSSKADFLLKGLSSQAVVQHREYNYKFTSVGKTTFDEDSFIYGYLVKYDPKFDEETIDENTGSLSGTLIENKVNAKCRFIIHPESSIIVFHEVGQLINRNTFISKFCDLFEKNHGNFFIEFNIQPLLEKYSFIDEVKKFIALKKVMISLVPSNPSFSDRWQRIDERLRDNKVSNYKEVYENKRDQESLSVDEEMENKFLMSEDGYGESRAHGITERGERTITTKNKNKQVKVRATSNTEDVVFILEKIRSSLNELIKRTDGDR